MTRLESLLVVRVVATAMVVFGHAASFYKGFSITQWPRFPYLHYVAVVVFFVVSGWTIAWVLHTRAGDTLGKFCFDRLVRLMVPLVPIVVLYAALEAWYFGGEHDFPDAFSPVDFVGNLFFLQDLDVLVPPVGSLDLDVQPFGLNVPLWTVALEFWIYVGFGGLWQAMSGRVVRSTVTAIALAAVLLGPRVFGGRGAGLPLVWLVGAVAFLATRNTPEFTTRTRGVLASVWVLCACAVFSRSLWPEKGTYSATFNWVIAANVVFVMLVVPGLRVPAVVLKWAAVLGSFSYSTYLVHYPLMHIARNEGLVTPGKVGVIYATLTSFVLGWLYSLLFERHYRVIRDYLWKRWAHRFRSGRAHAARLAVDE
jgi:peptidoglycan/LPS O-acetylase OafA/YrhL